MNNQWYINSAGKNKGPYTALELQQMFEDNQINSFSLCYNKSLGKWIPYFDAKNFFTDDSVNLPPLPEDLPSIPDLEDGEDKKVEKVVQLNTPKKVVGKKKTVRVERVKQKSSDRLSSYVIGFASLSIIIALFGTFLLFKSKEKRDIVFKNISFDVLKSLQDFSKKDASSKFYMKFGLDKNSEVIFGRSNLAMDAQVSVHFKRTNSDNLGDNVSFSSSAILKNGSIVLKELDFIEGEKIIEGEYDIKVQAMDTSLFRRLKNFIFKNSNSYNFEERALLIPSNIKEYEQNIASIKATKILFETEILTGFDQKLQTIDSILTSMALHYRLSLNKESGQESSKEFETRYANSAGPLLQSIILEDFESLLLKSEQKVELRKISGDIHISAKEISALSATLSKDLSKIKKLTPKTRNQKREMLAELNGELKQKINNIREEITSLLNKVKSE